MSDDAPASSPWIGSTYRHIPVDADILNFEFAGLFGDNRWNHAGEPTLYLAADQGVLATEWARHLPYPWPANVGHRALTRQVHRLHIHLNRVLDVRDHAFIRRCGVEPSTDWFADMSSARHVANVVRHTTTQAIIVPSIAFVDDHTRWNLVVFLDKVPEDTSQWVVSTESIGLLQWGES